MATATPAPAAAGVAEQCAVASTPGCGVHDALPSRGAELQARTTPASSKVGGSADASSDSAVGAGSAFTMTHPSDAVLLMVDMVEQAIGPQAVWRWRRTPGTPRGTWRHNG
jgi:hypothetical protein